LGLSVEKRLASTLSIPDPNPPYARNKLRTIRTSAPNVLSVPTLAAAAVDRALALALVVVAPTVAIVADVMVALEVMDPRVVDVTGVGSTGTGNVPVLPLIMPLLIILLLPIMLPLIILLPLIVAPDKVAVVDGVIALDMIGIVEVVPRMAEGVGVIVVVPGPTMPVRVGRDVTAETCPIAPHEAEAHTVQLCIMR